MRLIDLARFLARINPMTEPMKARPIGGNRPVYMMPQGIHGGKPVKATKRYADGRQKDQRLRRLSRLTVGSHFVAPKPSSHAIARKEKAKETQ